MIKLSGDLSVEGLKSQISNLKFNENPDGLSKLKCSFFKIINGFRILKFTHHISCHFPCVCNLLFDLYLLFEICDL